MTITARELAEKLMETPDLIVYNETMLSDRDGDYYINIESAADVKITPDGVFITFDGIDYADENLIRSPGKKPSVNTFRIKLLSDNPTGEDYFHHDEDSAQYVFQRFLNDGYYIGYDTGKYETSLIVYTVEPKTSESTDCEHILSVDDIEYVEVVIAIDEEWKPIVQHMDFEEALGYYKNRYNLIVEEEE